MVRGDRDYWDDCNDPSVSVAIQSLSPRLIRLTARDPGSLHEADDRSAILCGPIAS